MAVSLFVVIWLVLRNVLAALPDLSTGGCGGDDPLWLGRAGSGRRRLSSLFAGSFYFPIWGRSTRPKICSPRSCTIWLRSHWVFSPRTAAANCEKIINENTAQTENFLAHQLPDMTGSAVTAVTMLVMLLFFGLEIRRPVHPSAGSGIYGANADDQRKIHVLYAEIPGRFGTDEQ